VAYEPEHYRLIIVGAKPRVTEFAELARSRSLEVDDERPRSRWRTRRDLCFISVAAMLPASVKPPAIPSEAHSLAVLDVHETESGWARAAYRGHLDENPTDLIVAVSKVWADLRFLVVCGAPDSGDFWSVFVSKGQRRTSRVPDAVYGRILTAKFREHGIEDPDADGVSEDDLWLADVEADDVALDNAEARGERLLAQEIARVPPRATPAPGDRYSSLPDYRWRHVRSLRELALGHGLEFVHRIAGPLAFVSGYPTVESQSRVIKVRLLDPTRRHWAMDRDRRQRVLETQASVMYFLTPSRHGRAALRHGARHANVTVLINA
jgi:hypothetical protein